MKPPTQVAAAAANISPQGSLHCRCEATRPLSIGSANVLVMNKELVEIRQSADPGDAEQPDGRPGPDPRDEPREVLAVSQSDPALLSEPFEGAWQNEARAGNEIAFSQHDVGGEVTSGPALQQGGNVGTKLLQEITEFTALLRVQPDISHAAAVYEELEACGARSAEHRDRRGNPSETS